LQINVLTSIVCIYQSPSSDQVFVPHDALSAQHVRASSIFCWSPDCLELNA